MNSPWKSIQFITHPTFLLKTFILPCCDERTRFLSTLSQSGQKCLSYFDKDGFCDTLIRSFFPSLPEIACIIVDLSPFLIKNVFISYFEELNSAAKVNFVSNHKR